MKADLDSRHTSVRNLSQSMDVARFRSHHIQRFLPNMFGFSLSFLGDQQVRDRRLSFTT